MSKLTRKEFLRLTTAGLGALAGGSILSACSPASPSAPTLTPVPVLAPTPSLTVTPRAIRRPDIIKTYPVVKSSVIRAHHAGAWDGDNLSPTALQQMLDASITKLTGLNDAKEAWLSVFQPHERIVLKVNSILTGITHVPLVLAVANRLQAAGIPTENIVIFDRYEYELHDAGYQLNRDGAGVRCIATEFDYSRGWTLLKKPIRLSNVLLGCDAVINIPILKAAGGMGISFAMKNHYGTFDVPFGYHHSYEHVMPELNAIPAIRDRARLVIGDLLTTKSTLDSFGFRMIGTGDAILMSFDPVAHDTVGMQFAVETLKAQGKNPTATLKQASSWLDPAAQMGLGAFKPEDFNLIDLKVA